jgi:pimeloyl-ACP methyl ester carboxylesterase
VPLFPDVITGRTIPARDRPRYAGGDPQRRRHRGTLGPVHPGRDLAVHPRPSTYVRRAAVGLGLSLLLAACGGAAGGPNSPSRSSAPTTTIPATPTTTTTTTTTTTELPVAPISWSACGVDLQCGSVTVPLDYAHPTGATIGIAVERHLADEPANRIGSLVINPGGPGVSGIDDFANELASLTPELLDDFDIVTFDPRGVQRSNPVTCGETQGAAQGPLPNPVPRTAAEQRTLLADMRQFAGDCERASGAMLPYVGTVDVARDLDRLRQALGDRGLTYMGQSYGTLLGATYAQLFPTHIRAMVLDSPIDPALSFDQMTLGQAEGFEGALTSFFAWCAGDASCPWRPAGNPTSALLALLGRSDTNPAPAGSGRTAGTGELYDALLDGLYARSDWPTLAAALGADEDGDGSPVVAMSNHYSADGSTNGADAAEAIDCLDHPASKDLASYGSLAQLFATSAPVFGPLLAWGEAGCAVWPVAASRTPAPATAPGSPPVLVVGTTQDPATPYSWSVSVAHELSQGHLLTVEGSDHVSYFYSACVRAYVQTYLVSLATPPVGATCSD